jgi:hypothetical protein
MSLKKARLFTIEEIKNQIRLSWKNERMMTYQAQMESYHYISFYKFLFKFYFLI